MRIVQFIAIVLTALMLVPTGAHFFELPNKLGLPQEQYFVVQQIYRGCSHFGIVLFGALAANLVLMIMLRSQHAACWFALAAFLLIGATLAIFFILIYPVNQATENWTVELTKWPQLRTQWEYSHAANALLTFAALSSVVVATLKGKP